MAYLFSYLFEENTFLFLCTCILLQNDKVQGEKNKKEKVECKKKI